MDLITKGDFDVVNISCIPEALEASGLGWFRRTYSVSS